MVKNILLFLAGGGVGAGISWIFARRKYLKELDEQVAALDKFYAEKEAAKKSSDTEETTDFCEVAEEPAKESAPDEYSFRPKASSEDVLIRADLGKHDYVHYHDIYGKDKEEIAMQENDHPKDDLYDAPDSDPWEGEHSDTRLPRVIKAIDFGVEPGYRSISLLYYQEDDTLAYDDIEDVEEEDRLALDEVEDLLGDTLTKYGFKDNDEPQIYVRNYARKCDYVIEKVFGAYGED